MNRNFLHVSGIFSCIFFTSKNYFPSLSSVYWPNVPVSSTGNAFIGLCNGFCFLYMPWLQSVKGSCAFPPWLQGLL